MKVNYAKNFYEIANVHTSNKFLIYKFNITSIKKLKNTYYKMIENKSCSFDKQFKEKFYHEIEKNMLWNKTIISTRNDSNTNEINIHFLYDIILNSNIDTQHINQNRNFKCQIICETMENFIRTNNILNELYKHNTSTIFEVITEEQLMRDIGNIIRTSKNDGTFPFDLLDYIPNDLFKFTEFSFTHDNFEITMRFTIPFFKKDLLYKIYPKPIIIDNEPYILDIDLKYAFLNNIENIYFTNETFENYCSWYTKELYCYKPEEKLNCEIENISKDSLDCYKKLPYNNIITQIEQNTYFIIFIPTIIQIKCEDSEFKIELFNHSQILKNYECSITKSYFEYIPFNTSNYKIYIDESNNMDTIIQKMRHENHLNNLRLEMIALLLALITYFIIFISAKIQVKKKARNTTYL